MRFSGSGKRTLFVALAAAFIIAAGFAVGCSIRSRGEASVSTTDSDRVFVRDLSMKLTATTNRLEQESILRAVYWLVHDSDGELQLQISIADKDGQTIRELDELTPAESLSVTVSVHSQPGNWVENMQFTPYHINNVYLLMSDSE